MEVSKDFGAVGSNRFLLFWISGHVGSQRNQAADSLVKRSVSTSFSGPEPALGIASATAKAAILTLAEKKD